MQVYAAPRIRSGYVLQGDSASNGGRGCVARPPTQQKCGHSARPAATRSHAGRVEAAAAKLAVESRLHLPPVLPTPASWARPVVSHRAQPSQPLPEIPRAQGPAPNVTVHSQLHLACSPRHAECNRRHRSTEDHPRKFLRPCFVGPNPEAMACLSRNPPWLLLPILQTGSHCWDRHRRRQYFDVPVIAFSDRFSRTTAANASFGSRAR